MKTTLKAVTALSHTYIAHMSSVPLRRSSSLESALVGNFGVMAHLFRNGMKISLYGIGEVTSRYLSIHPGCSRTVSYLMLDEASFQLITEDTVSIQYFWRLGKEGEMFSHSMTYRKVRQVKGAFWFSEPADELFPLRG